MFSLRCILKFAGLAVQESGLLDLLTDAIQRPQVPQVPQVLKSGEVMKRYEKHMKYHKWRIFSKCGSLF